MKTKSIMKNERYYISWMLIMFITICFGSCKSDSDKAEGFDPDKPTVISSFTPEEGSIGTRMIIYGENFGTDVSKVKVTIGGIEAPIVGVDKTAIYCMVPAKAYDGDVKVEILDDDGQPITKAEGDAKFTYVKKMRVSTFIGTKDDKGNFQVKDGPFEDCGGLGRTWWLSFDPKNHNHLYVAGQDQVLRLVDFEKRYLSSINQIGYKKIRSVCWTLQADSMIVTHDQDTETNPNNYVVSRESGFKSPVALTYGRNCNGAAVHPVNGELYYNYYNAGEVFRYDFETAQKERLFSIQDKDWDFNIQIHPSGNYAYLVVVQKHYILRSDYDWTNKRFTTPYIICGAVGTTGWADGVGKKVRLNVPSQGAFVKNEEYEERGLDDIYDFYFCDRENHCVRILTPDGKVTTFAGRGSPSLNNSKNGYINGDLLLEARFDGPEGIVYDEERECFFIGDRANRRIRKIGYEE
ncbi:MAG: IPT/TIG domain-containing protein [Dysgonomonas sp.]|nr:IPT/TIG domain-containing protein [Dysgonomonas sp.]